MITCSDCGSSNTLATTTTIFPSCIHPHYYWCKACYHTGVVLVDYAAKIENGRKTFKDVLGRLEDIAERHRKKREDDKYEEDE